MKLTYSQALLFDNADARTIDAECLPLQLVPIVARQLLSKTFRGAWQLGSSQAGKDATVRFIMSIYEGCLSPTSRAVDRQTRLLYNALLGVQFSQAVVNGALVVTPALPEGQPLAPVGAGLSLTEVGIRTRFVVENALLGNTSAGLSDNRNYRDMLQSIIDKAAGTGELDDDILAQLIQVVGLLA